MGNLLVFSENDMLGHVTHVDTEQIIIEIENSNLMNKICVGNLVAIETSKQHENLIALIDKVTRKYMETYMDEDNEIDEMMASSTDYIKVSVIGTYYSVYGSVHDLFKRDVETFPQIESKCYEIIGQNLQNFMNILGKDIDTDKRLKIGSFMMDTSAEAVLDGNKFFQRHAAVLGSTGSGKSWCVANILEKASKLKYTNIIVFDMHGEYKSLTEGTDAIAQSFKIAGPGDLETSNDDALFLPYWLLNREELLSMILDRSDSNAPNQASRFTLHIRSLKEATLTREGKTDTLKTFTVDSPIPFLMTDLLELLKDDDTRKGMGKNGPIKGEWEGKLTRFISRLETKIADKTYGFMFQPTDEIQMYNWLANLACRLLGYQSGQKGIKIIDFSEVPSDVLPVVTGTLARLLYDIQKFNNKTNGITFRRWLVHCNHNLAEYLKELIGPGYMENAEELEKLLAYQDEENVLAKLKEIKKEAKAELKKYLKMTQNVEIDENSVFDIQIKRLHEYKRQQMNALYAIYKYKEIKKGNLPKRPLTMIFGAKAAPAYTIAKDIIHLILCLQQLIDNDPQVSPYMKIVMVENYNVTKAEKLIPACDISEQISLASKEASGTGNMKFMLNGAVTLGTEDGANVEIHQLVGDDNIYIFGEKSEKIIKLYETGEYCSKDIYENDPMVEELVDFIISKDLIRIGDPVNLGRLYKEIVGKDWFMALLDVKDYIRTKEQMLSDYEDEKAWEKKMLVNIAKAGFFSSDRTIAEYNRDIWHL